MSKISDQKTDDFLKMLKEQKAAKTAKAPKGPKAAKTPQTNSEFSKKGKTIAHVTGLVLAALILCIAFFLLLVPINLRAMDFWLFMLLAASFYSFCAALAKSYIPALATAAMWVIFLILILSGAKMFHASEYASILKVEETEFTDDIPEASGTDSIALMDTNSAKMLGDREIGSLSNVVSQYNVSSEYVQINEKGKPAKVAPLEYAGFFKWINNKNSGVPGYVTVNPVTMSAEYTALDESMIYVPSAYLGQDAGRHIYLAYPTTMWENLHFEIDEEGNPYYVASVIEKSISLFGGRKVTGCIIMNPVTGEVSKYSLADSPEWVDMVISGNVLCEQYNWGGRYSGGFLNSLFGKKGCKKVTEYSASDEEGEDEVPTSDYGYVAKDGDIWIYTGITSLNSDSSNIGFLMANERTGEARFYSISGADEKSAMAAAEGEVQEKRYQASFPSLINVDGCPTYIMVLKDSSGLVKLYAAVNVEQYSLVTTATTQKECINKYKTLMGIAESSENPSSIDPAKVEEELTATSEKTIVVADIKYIDIDGNTYIYLISKENELFKAKAATHEEMLLLKTGDTVLLGLNGNVIVSCTRQ